MRFDEDVWRLRSNVFLACSVFCVEGVELLHRRGVSYVSLGIQRYCQGWRPQVRDVELRMDDERRNRRR
jgi:hypothetical protein